MLNNSSTVPVNQYKSKNGSSMNYNFWATDSSQQQNNLLFPLKRGEFWLDSFAIQTAKWQKAGLPALLALTLSYNLSEQNSLLLRSPYKRLCNLPLKRHNTMPYVSCSRKTMFYCLGEVTFCSTTERGREGGMGQRRHIEALGNSFCGGLCSRKRP